MPGQINAPVETTGKTHSDSAYLLRAIERGIVYDRLPAPISIDIRPEYGSAKLRFEVAEDVHAWAPLTGAAIATGPRIYSANPERPWHEVGTDQGGQEGRLAGWQVNMWASVDGLPPTPEPKPLPESVEQAQEWLFTFGSGQQHDGRFVRITGTHDVSRTRMVDVFGTAWCDQYDWRRFDQMGLLAELTELPQSEWPQAGPTPVAETSEEPTPDVQHRQTNGWNNGFDGKSAGVECACGEKFDGFPTMTDARKALGYHIAAGNAKTTMQAGR